MMKSSTGATLVALMWGTLASGQATLEQDRPATRQDIPRAGQQQQAQIGEQPGQRLGAEAGQQGQQTVRGRIVALGDHTQAGQAEQADAPRDEQTRQESAQGMYITVAADQGRGQQPNTIGIGDDPDRQRPENASAILRDDQPASRERAEVGQMPLYRFLVTERTQIQTAGDDALLEEGQRGQRETQGGRDPGQADQQQGQMEQRGLRVGQQVEVTYRLLSGDDAGFASQGDRPDANRPGQVQANQGSRPGQDQSPGQAIRGEAISIRVVSATIGHDRDLDRPTRDATQPGSELDPPGRDASRPGASLDRPNPDATGTELDREAPPVNP